MVRRGGSAPRPRRGAGELEREVLAALWACGGPASLGAVTAALDGEPAANTVQTIMTRLYGKDGEALIAQLEGGLPTIPLTSMPALSTAYANDTSGTACFAQMTQSLGREGDVLLAISTSGNSQNILLAVMAAKARHMTAICLTGRSGGKCRGLADICICVPEDETFKIQELHLPVYHALCAMAEASLFEENH